MIPFGGEKSLHLAYKLRLCAIRAWIRSNHKNATEVQHVSDAAENFKFMGHNNQLCWGHELKNYRKLEAVTGIHRELKDKILAIFYDFYKKLKLSQLGQITKLEIQTDFNFITKIETGI